MAQLGESRLRTGEIAERRMLQRQQDDEMFLPIRERRAFSAFCSTGAA